MSNTGHIKGRCRILVPVVVEYGATVKLDAGASLAKLIKLWSQGKRYPKGNVEDVWIEKIEDIDTIDWETDRKSTRLNSSHSGESRMPSSA